MRRRRKYHEIPEYYLRGFCEPGTSFVWVFRRNSPFSMGKNDSNPRRSGVGVTALRSDEYRARHRDGVIHFQYEEKLARIEAQANKVICKIRVFESIKESEKDILTQYVYLMLKRLTRRDRSLFPKLREVIVEGRNKVRMLSDDGKFVEAHMLGDEVDYLESKNGRIEYLRESMVHNLGFVHREIIGKRWEFVKAAAESYFVTTDNPVVFDHNFGLSVATLIFPLSQDVILVANRSEGKDLIYRDTSLSNVRKLNSMIIMYGEKEVYSPHPDEWIYRGWTEGFSFAGTGSDR
jgi:hypothetical protein